MTKTKITKLKTEPPEKKNKKDKIVIPKQGIERKTKKDTKSKEAAPKKKRGRPFGAKTKQRAPLDRKGYDALSKEAKKVWDLLEIRENDGAIALTQKMMLQTNIRMLPILEKNFYNSPGQASVYAFNAVVQSTRELIVDLQGSQDKSKVIDNVIHNILQPQILAFTNFLMNANHVLKKDLYKLIKDKYKRDVDMSVDNYTKMMGSYAQEMFTTLKDRLPSAME